MGYQNEHDLTDKKTVLTAESDILEDLRKSVLDLGNGLGQGSEKTSPIRVETNSGENSSERKEEKREKRLMAELKSSLADEQHNPIPSKKDKAALRQTRSHEPVEICGSKGSKIGRGLDGQLTRRRETQNFP